MMLYDYFEHSSVFTNKLCAATSL